MIRKMLFHPFRTARTAKRIATIGAAGLTAAGVGAGILGALYLTKRVMPKLDLGGKVIVITGGSRGLGFALAQEAAKQGAHLVLCARRPEELKEAEAALQHMGAQVLTIVCDVSDPDDVADMITTARTRFGQIDVLINNAGIITVGPLESQTITDYQESMDVIFWGTVYPTLAVLPEMMQRGCGAIVNITSIGGKIAVPHLLPYSAAKFASVGFSEGLRSEAKKYGVNVTTVCPGLMRTGSHLNAYFKGNNRAEFTWFSLGASLPFVSIDARKAANKILRAVRHEQSELIFPPQMRLAASFHGLFPGLTTDILALVDRFMPEAPHGDDRSRHLGKYSETTITRSGLLRYGREAAREYHQTGA